MIQRIQSNAGKRAVIPSQAYLKFPNFQQDRKNTATVTRTLEWKEVREATHNDRGMKNVVTRTIARYSEINAYTNAEMNDWIQENRDDRLLLASVKREINTRGQTDHT